MQRLTQFALIAGFALLIGVPGLMTLCGHRNFAAVESIENRYAAKMPSMPTDLNAATTFGSEFEAFFNDHFGFRSKFVRWNNMARLNYLKTSLASMAASAKLPGAVSAQNPSVRQNAKKSQTLSDRVLPGKDGWYFLDYEDVVDDYRGLVRMSDDELKSMARNITDRQQWLAKQGIRYLIVVAPNGLTVYSEHLPDALTRLDSETRTDQCVRYLREHTDIELIDLRPTLIAAKSLGRVWHRTDSHWNALGAWAGYREIHRHIQKHFPEVGPARSLDEFTIEEVANVPGGDLAGCLGQDDVIRETEILLHPKQATSAKSVQCWSRQNNQDEAHEHPDDRLPRVVVQHDSYMPALIPFLSEHFSRSRYLWSAPVFETQIICDEAPDLVIDEICEQRVGPHFAAHSAELNFAYLTISPNPPRVFPTLVAEQPTSPSDTSNR